MSNNYNQRIELDTTKDGDEFGTITITLSDGNWPVADLREEYTDYSRIDLYQKDVPALVKKLMESMGIDVENDEYLSELLG